MCLHHCIHRRVRRLQGQCRQPPGVPDGADLLLRQGRLNNAVRVPEQAGLERLHDSTCAGTSCSPSSAITSYIPLVLFREEANALLIGAPDASPAVVIGGGRALNGLARRGSAHSSARAPCICSSSERRGVRASALLMAATLPPPRTSNRRNSACLHVQLAELVALHAMCTIPAADVRPCTCLRAGRQRRCKQQPGLLLRPP